VPKGKYAKTTSKKGKRVFKRTRMAGYQSGRSNPSQTQNELKCFDVAQQAIAFATTAAGGTFVSSLNAMSLGSDLYQRIGRKIKMKSLRFRGTIQPHGTNQQVGSGLLRFIIYYDAQPNAGVPSVTDILQDSNATAGVNTRSEMNMNNRARFQILRDHQTMAPAQGGTANQWGQPQDPGTPNVYQFDYFIKLKGLETMYNATNGGNIGDITSGAIGVFAIQDTTVTAASCDLVFTSRLRFFD